ncbi:hypothetical protein HAX54_031066 [Datura stramonium]|uniref:Uncharacterized protein n=1 Tax=Datura stramonium TaxID=4076 RepID=A0ABS8VAY8_DATST|nr:hypothetical protein [Datura stramonium]
MWASLTSSSVAPSATTAFSTRIVATTTAKHRSQYKCVIGVKVKEKARDMVVRPRGNQLEEAIQVSSIDRNIQEIIKSSRMIIGGKKVVQLKGQRLILMALLHPEQQLVDTSFLRMSCVNDIMRPEKFGIEQVSEK